jgi:hypothetical protein
MPSGRSDSLALGRADAEGVTEGDADAAGELGSTLGVPDDGSSTLGGGGWDGCSLVREVDGLGLGDVVTAGTVTVGDAVAVGSGLGLGDSVGEGSASVTITVPAIEVPWIRQKYS